MPWNNQGGGWQGGGRGPWGQGGGGQGRQPQSPDLEDLLRKGQDRFRSIIPGGSRSPRAILLAVLVILVIWLLTGFYRVQPDEQGVVLRFGQWINTTEPGLHYHLPSPIESVQTPKVTRVRRVDVGFRSAGEATRRGGLGDLPEESLMLTGDENIVDIDFSVFWTIKDAGLFLFNVQDPTATVKNVAEGAMRETIGRSQFQFVVAEGRASIERETRNAIQAILDGYNAGIDIDNVQLQKVDPPGAVIDAFRDVQRARADLETQVNEAQTYQNDILPRARGDAVRMEQEAEAYKEQTVQTAEGDAQRFTSIYNEYKSAREITARRMYLETMEKVLGRMNKIVIDPSSTGQGSGVVPYLPLTELTRPGSTRNTTTGGN